MHVDQWKKIPLEGIDEVTLIELSRFIELKLDEQARIKGQIAKDLRRIGEYAFLDASAYDQLAIKYKACGNRKKLAILDLMREENLCTNQS